MSQLLTNFVSVFPYVKKHGNVLQRVYIWYYWICHATGKFHHLDASVRRKRI